MADGWTIDDIDACALTTAVDLLDALIDSAMLARPGRDAAPYARDLRYLADSATVAAADLAALLPLPLPLPLPEQRAVA